MSDELSPKPCPFCTSKNVRPQSETEEWNISQVRCRDCGAIGPFVDIGEYAGGMTWEAEKKAIALWNTRAKPLPAGDVVERVQDKLCPDCGKRHDPFIRCPNYHAGMHG